MLLVLSFISMLITATKENSATPANHLASTPKDNQ